MKTCPTCQTPVFDDMARCFSCLFNFEEAPNLDESFLSIDEPPTLSRIHKSPDKNDNVDAIQTEPETAPRQIPQTHLSNAAPEAQTAASLNEWVIRVEIRSSENPAQTWSMEFSPTNWATAKA